MCWELCTFFFLGGLSASPTCFSFSICSYKAALFWRMTASLFSFSSTFFFLLSSYSTSFSWSMVTVPSLPFPLALAIQPVAKHTLHEYIAAAKDALYEYITESCTHLLVFNLTFLKYKSIYICPSRTNASIGNTHRYSTTWISQCYT